MTFSLFSYLDQVLCDRKQDLVLTEDECEREWECDCEREWERQLLPPCLSSSPLPLLELSCYREWMSLQVASLYQSMMLLTFCTFGITIVSLLNFMSKLGTNLIGISLIFMYFFCNVSYIHHSLSAVWFMLSDSQGCTGSSWKAIYNNPPRNLSFTEFRMRGAVCQHQSTSARFFFWFFFWCLYLFRDDIWQLLSSPWWKALTTFAPLLLWCVLWVRIWRALFIFPPFLLLLPLFRWMPLTAFRLTFFIPTWTNSSAAQCQDNRSDCIPIMSIISWYRGYDSLYCDI